MSEGIGEARPEAEGELALARLALEDGELPHAAKHVASAIGRDPTLRAAYAALDELAAAAADAMALVPVDGTPHAGAVAARSYLMARGGHLAGGIAGSAAPLRIDHTASGLCAHRSAASSRGGAGSRSGTDDRAGCGAGARHRGRIHGRSGD